MNQKWCATTEVTLTLRALLNAGTWRADREGMQVGIAPHRHKDGQESQPRRLPEPCDQTPQRVIERVLRFDPRHPGPPGARFT
jgi:hypothetical protein